MLVSLWNFLVQTAQVAEIAFKLCGIQLYQRLMCPFDYCEQKPHFVGVFRKILARSSVANTIPMLNLNARCRVLCQNAT
jgi:hypothetical protein